MPLCVILAYEVIGVSGGAHHAEEGREAGREGIDLARHVACVLLSYGVMQRGVGRGGVEGRRW
jgi:hypothetical protein